jgi:hypothetical protein
VNGALGREFGWLAWPVVSSQGSAVMLGRQRCCCCYECKGRERVRESANERERRGRSGRAVWWPTGRCGGVVWPPHGSRGLPARHGGTGATVVCGRRHREGEGLRARAGPASAIGLEARRRLAGAPDPISLFLNCFLNCFQIKF